MSIGKINDTLFLGMKENEEILEGREKKMAFEEKLLLGTVVAKTKTEELSIRTQELKRGGVIPKLCIMRVGERPDDISYERGAVKRMQNIGIEAEVQTFAQSITQDEFLQALEKNNKDESIHGIIIFMPLPKQLDVDEIKATILPSKDVDCISPANVAKLLTGEEGLVPCTPMAVIELMKYHDIEMQGKHVVVIGRSMVVGKPLSMLLLRENATVTVCHSKTEGLDRLCRDADLVVCALGKSKFLTSKYVNEKSIVIDVGIHVDEEGNMNGDVNFDDVAPVVAKITPVPRGVGSITTVVLAKQVLESAAKA